MVEEAVKRRLFRLFADILEYPRPGLTESVRECEALMTSEDAETEALLAKFHTFVEEKSLERMQEVYSSTFDLNATYHPYVGYHLLGESYKRSAFLLELKKRYQAQGFITEEKELPDHLAVTLRFLAVSNDEDMAKELVCEALLPALEKMLRENEQADRPENDIENPDRKPDCGISGCKPDSETPEFKSEEKGNRRTRQTSPYRNVLKALRIVLQQQYPVVKEVENHV